MTVMDSYRVIMPGQKVIVKDYSDGWNEIYNGYIEHIPLNMFDRNITWLGTSDVYVGTLELIIE